MTVPEVAHRDEIVNVPVSPRYAFRGLDQGIDTFGQSVVYGPVIPEEDAFPAGFESLRRNPQFWRSVLLDGIEPGVEICGCDLLVTVIVHPDLRLRTRRIILDGGGHHGPPLIQTKHQHEFVIGDPTQVSSDVASENII